MKVTLGNYRELSRQGKIRRVPVIVDGQPTPDTATTMVCPVCGVTIQETLTGCRKFDDKYHCSDCYFDKIGEWLDDHPVGVPHLRR